MFPGAQILDVSGPLEVFSTACRELAEAGTEAAPYALEVVATAAGPVRTSSGVMLVADRAIAHADDEIDTLIVAGGEGTAAALRDHELIDWLRRTFPTTTFFCRAECWRAPFKRVR